MTFNAIPAGQNPGEEPGVVIYQSPTTRVVRSAGALILKEYSGPNSAQRLRRERDVLKRLAGIDGVAQLAASSGADGLVLRDNGAGTLAQAMQATRLDIDTVLSLACQLARTLAAVHRAGVIHRDINPGNILLTGAGEAVLIDFDLAMLAGHRHFADPEPHIVGTLSYIAPEQTGRTGRSVDERADLYALGATLYAMTTGRPPFGQADALQLVHDHLVRQPIAPGLANADIPQGLSDIIMRLLAKAPEQRFQSAEGLHHDLERLRGAWAQGAGSGFELGERDFPARLSSPVRLVGRDAEVAALVAAFGDALHTPRRTVLVSGPAGVGKSMLIDALKPVVAQAGGWFAQGKFDQYQGGTTGGALTQALRSLGRLLLSQPAEAAAGLRQRILQHIGRGTELITRAAPEFALLLGVRSDPDGLDPRQAGPLLQQAVIELLALIASPATPLVFFVEDLQWADAYSLAFFEKIMTDANLRGVMLLASLRDDGSSAGTAVRAALERWQAAAAAPVRLDVPNLSPDSLAELLRRMLRLAPDASNALADALLALTGGNPFDTIEMINALRGDGLLRLGASGWEWDDADVRHFVGRGNVVDLLAARINRLPPASRELLASMSCLGSSVDYRLLGAASGLGDGELRLRLRPPLDDGLLMADGDASHERAVFRHDRVQQALLDTMTEAQRAGRQLAMARRLAEAGAFDAEAAEQYLACAALLDAPAERRQTAGLFYRLAQALASSAAYTQAEQYLSAADTLLSPMAAEEDAPLRASIDEAWHCALYCLGRTGEADPLFARIEARAANPLDLVDAACLQLRSLNIDGRWTESQALGVQMLARLGLQVPADFGASQRESRLDSLQAWVARERRLDPAGRAKAPEARLQGIYKVMGRLLGSSFLARDAGMHTWLQLEGLRLWEEEGPAEALLPCLISFSQLLITVRQDYRLAHEVGSQLVATADALGFEFGAAGARFMNCLHSSIWFEPLEACIDSVEQAFQVFLAKGEDPSFASYIKLVKYVFMLEVAPRIEMCESEIEDGLSRARRTGNTMAAVFHTLERQFLRLLLGQTRGSDSLDDDSFNEQALMKKFGHLARLKQWMVYFHALRALLWCDAESLARHGASESPNQERLHDSSQYRMVHHHLIASLAVLWPLQHGGRPASGAQVRPAQLAQVETSRDWLAARAADQPHNFHHLLLLLDAERAWADGEHWKAATCFDAAVVESEGKQRPWHRAFIAERAGLFNLAFGLTGTGRHLLVKARDHYQAWGASAKVEQMLATHAFLRSPARSLMSQLGGPDGQASSSKGVSSDVLELIGVLRASQALSSETSQEQLTARVTDVVASLSGATKVLVLSSSEDGWRLRSPDPATRSMPVAEAAIRGMLPLSAFAYVQRTGEALVVDDATSDFRFARDSYFAGLSVCSLLAVPFTAQGGGRAMLILENRLGPAAFNAQRLDAVMLIAGQLAVSLANAQLYENLEQRVKERTRELQETQAHLVTTARRAGMAQIANNVLHNVGNVLNSINVSASVLRDTLGNSRLEGLARAVALINEHAHDLPKFMATDPRATVLWPYLNDLVGALRSEREEALSDLDRLTRSVEHIIYIVSRQQAHSGPSSVLETTGPQELIEEALYLSADAISRRGITVVRRFAEVPATALDKQRLVQILVNLIGNAAQAMDNTPAASRQLTLGIDLAPGEAGQRLRITVQDTGEGIAPENMARLFSHGFTTRSDGHGFGLHSSAVAATELDGKLAAHSDGPGRGAIFTIDMPLPPA